MKKNIVLITLDSVNLDNIEDNIDSLPNIKKLKDEGIDYSNAFSVGCATPFSFPAIAAGIYPYNHGTKIPNDINNIGEIMRKTGYNTAFINESNAFLSSHFGYTFGFDFSENFLSISHKSKDRELEDKLSHESSDNTYNPKLKHKILVKTPRKLRRGLRLLDGLKSFIELKYLKENHKDVKERRELYASFAETVDEFIQNQFEDPQFMWVHTIVNHYPYLPSKDSNWNKKNVNNLNLKATSGLVHRFNKKEIKELYDDSLKQTDELIGEIIEALREEEKLEDTVVILTSDHGEEFLESGYFGHKSESSSEELLNVPLTIWSKDLDGNKSEKLCSTIDIPKTIIDLADSEETVPNGKNLIEIAEGNQKRKFAYSEGWIRNHLLDKSPGSNSLESYFTIRNQEEKLTVRLKNKSREFNEMHLENWRTDHQKEKPSIIHKLSKKLMSHLYEG